MGFMDNIRSFMSVNDEFEDEEYGYEDEQVEEREVFSNSSATASPKEVPAQRNKQLSLHTNSQLSVVLVKPTSFAEATEIADHLNKKRTVILNLESASKDISRRLVDFLGGAAYANGGELKRVANSTFIIVPKDVDMMGDESIDDIVESGGIYI